MRLLLFTLSFFVVSIASGSDLKSTSDSVEKVAIKVERKIEEWRHKLLADVQSSTKINAFTTDGCSGGMSDGWQYMARVIPIFKTKFGDKPPWESCCIEHDRAYWQGEPNQGFTKRLRADQMLRQCVVDYGVAHSEALSQEYSLNQKLIETNFTITARLMYRAVRLGGQPCTLFPWRWGYGWPECNNNHNGE